MARLGRQLLLMVAICLAVTGHGLGDASLKDVADVSRNSQTLTQRFQNIGSYFNFLEFGLFFVDQIFPARTDFIFPTLPFLRTNPGLYFGKLKVCEKKDVLSCMRYGNATNGLPEKIQGAFWTEGLGTPSDVITSAGVWDAKRRNLIISPLYDYAWAYKATNSTWMGFYWSGSGASGYNALFFLENYFDITFNEDFTFGQILVGSKIFGLGFTLPTWVADWTMEWIEDGLWIRKSTIFFGLINIPGGDYNLKRIINGDGTKGPYFDKGWLTYANGTAIAVPYRIFPPY